jgi:hypothetical protein
MIRHSCETFPQHLQLVKVAPDCRKTTAMILEIGKIPDVPTTVIMEVLTRVNRFRELFRQFPQEPSDADDPVAGPTNHLIVGPGVFGCKRLLRKRQGKVMVLFYCQ